MPTSGWLLPNTTRPSSAKSGVNAATSIASTNAKRLSVWARVVARIGVPLSQGGSVATTIRDTSCYSQDGRAVECISGHRWSSQRAGRTWTRQAPPSSVGSYSSGNRRQGAMEIQVYVDVFQRRGERRKQLVGQRVEEQAPDQRHVTRSCRVDRVATGLCQNRIGCPAVILRWNPLSEAAFA